MRPSHALGTKGALLFQAAREVWAKTLWINLNAEALLDGMDSFKGEFRRYNDSVKRLPVGQFLDMHMKQFKNSVPLFVELKNEALRERHWEELMDKTGECDSVFNDFLQPVGKRRKGTFDQLLLILE